jgi:hypothetical protein
MSDDSDAEFERRYPQRRPGMPVWAILLIVLGSTGFLGCVGVLGLGLFGLSAAPVPPGPPAVAMATVEPPQFKVMYTRDEFEMAVMGKTVAEVKALLGDPPISGGADGDETWMYRGRTTDPATRLTDDMTDVVFKGGKVVRVNYRSAAPPGGPGPPPPQR